MSNDGFSWLESRRRSREQSDGSLTSALAAERRLTRALQQLGTAEHTAQGTADALLLAGGGQWATYIEVARGRLTTTAHAGVPIEPVDGPIPPDTMWRSVLDGDPRVVLDPAEFTASGHHFLSTAPWRTLVLVPVKLDDEVVAIVATAADIPDEEWGAEVAEAVVDHLAPVVATRIRQDRVLRRLEAVSDIDPLTGLLNTHGWEQRFPVELSRAGRTGTDVTLLLLVPTAVTPKDLDVNVELRVRFADFAEHVASSLRRVDLAARVSPVRLALGLSSCRGPDARRLIARILDPLGEDWPCVVGGATWNRVETAEELAERAQYAMYAAGKTTPSIQIDHEGPAAPESPHVRPSFTSR